MSHLRPLALLLTLLAAVLTACGTTVPASELTGGGGASASMGGLSTSNSPGGQSGGSSALPGGQQSATATPAGGSAPSAVSAGGGGSAAAGNASGSTGLTAGGSPTQGAGASPTQGGGLPGATASSTAGPIKVAFFYVQGGNQVLSSAFPGSSASFGNGQAEAQALIDDVNNHGGVNGRKLSPYFVAVPATAATDADLEQDCKAAVDDDHPLVILSVFNLGTDEASCAAQTHTLVIVVGLGTGDKLVYEQGQNYVFTPSQLSRDAEAALVLTLAHDENRISPTTKVGIFSESDDPMYDRVATSTMAPLLKSWKVPYLQEDFDPSQLSQISSAVLQFKTAGVTSVIFSCGSGGIPEVLFMQAASQQDYSPKYLMGDSTDPSFVASAAPKTEVSNIWGAGTMPLADVTASQYPTTPTEQHCLNVMNASFSPGYSNRGSSLTATLYCEQVYSFVAVAKKVQGPLSATSWVGAYRTFGTGYTPVTTFGTDFAGNDYSASEYREMAWNGTCSCISYTSPIRPIPTT